MKTTMTKTLISIVASICAISAMVVNVGAETCYLTQQLADPANRAEYQQKIAEAKAAAVSRFGASYSYSVSFTNAAGDKLDIDSFSYDCILCHDGINAKYHDINYRSGKRSGITLKTVLDSHPIGMSYGAMAYDNAKLRHQTTLNEELVLVDGRVGCLSCHNMLNPEKYHLAMSNESSELCLSCHIK